MSILTAELDKNSIETVRSLINKKNTTRPYMASGNVVSNVITDMDHWPYTRYFRGVYYFPDPIIMEREAGFRPREDNCYNLNIPMTEVPENNLCFQSACSTIFPCNPSRFADKQEHDDRFSENCIVQYR